jgi:hypothetical protein
MNDPLLQLLHQADASFSPPRAAPDITAIVRRRLRRRRVQSASIAAVSAAAVVLIGISLVRSGAAPPPRVVKSGSSRGAPVSLDSALAALNVDVRLHELTAERLLQLRASARAAQPAVADTLQLDLRQQRDRAALILVYEGDEQARQRQPAQAIARYRRTIALFPNTHWAAVARQRLKEIST